MNIACFLRYQTGLLCFIYLDTRFEVDCGLAIGYQLHTRVCLQLLIEANSFTSGHLIPLYFSYVIGRFAAGTCLLWLCNFIIAKRSLTQRLLQELDFSTFWYYVFTDNVVIDKKLSGNYLSKLKYNQHSLITFHSMSLYTWQHPHIKCAVFQDDSIWTV